MTTSSHTYTGLPHYLRWCVLSTPEIQKCGDMAVAFSRQRLKPEIQCVSAESPQHCMEWIQVGVVPRGAEWAGGPGHGCAQDGPSQPLPCTTRSEAQAVFCASLRKGRGKD